METPTMRSFVVALLLVLPLLPLPGAAAEALLDDGQGDTQVRVFGLPAGAPVAATGEAADLLALDIIEDAEELTFVLAIHNLKQPVSFAEYAITFTWAKDEYSVVVRRAVAQGVVDDNSDAFLINHEDDRWDAFAYLDHDIDVEKGIITVHLPKPYILSENGRYPLLGDALEDLYVEAESHVSFFQFTAEAYDRMPDEEGVAEYAFQYGDIASGKLSIDADERVRVSNGGATTFVYQVIVANKGDLDDDVEIVLSDMPEGWNGTVKSPVRVPGGAERRVAILVSVPFAHDHGGFSSFNASVRSQTDPNSYGAIRLGVLHTPIPQPAGHHSELYLHSRAWNGGIFAQILPWTAASINTDANHDGDAAEASPYRGGDGFTWYIPLDPVLRMGLDFDLDKLGSVAGNIIGRNKVEGTLRAELLLVTDVEDETDGLLLADSEEIPLALDLTAPASFKLTLTPTAESDYIPYARGQNMALLLYFEEGNEGIGTICCLPGNTPGLVVADFKMVLPLNEYHDKLTGLSESADSLEIKADGPVEKAGYPGATMTYAFTIRNRATTEEVVNLDLAGTDATLGKLVPGGAVTLGSGETRRITLAVAIPTDKNDGEELEVLLFAHAQSDPSKSAIARTKTIVAKTGSGEVVADESALLLAAQEAENNDTPGAAVYGVVGVLAAAAFLMRRRVR